MSARHYNAVLDDQHELKNCAVKFNLRVGYSSHMNIDTIDMVRPLTPTEKSGTITTRQSQCITTYILLGETIMSPLKLKP